jgi:hypothetical protein
VSPDNLSGTVLFYLTMLANFNRTVLSQGFDLILSAFLEIE